MYVEEVGSVWQALQGDKPVASLEEVLVYGLEKRTLYPHMSSTMCISDPDRGIKVIGSGQYEALTKGASECANFVELSKEAYDAVSGPTFDWDDVYLFSNQYIRNHEELSTHPLWQAVVGNKRARGAKAVYSLYGGLDMHLPKPPSKPQLLFFGLHQGSLICRLGGKYLVDTPVIVEEVMEEPVVELREEYVVSELPQKTPRVQVVSIEDIERKTSPSFLSKLFRKK